MVQLIGTVYRWAGKAGEVAKGFNTDTTDISRFRERARDRYLTSEEIARLGDALIEAETAGIPWTVDESKPTAKHAPQDERLLRLPGPCDGGIPALDPHRLPAWRSSQRQMG